MIHPMFIRFSLTISLLIATGFNATLCSQDAGATKIDAPPLPRQRDLKDFSNGEGLAPRSTLFQRRPDYRETEAIKKKEQEDAQKAAVERAKAAREEQIQSARSVKLTPRQYLEIKGEICRR